LGAGEERAVVAVGPEGGWSARELQEMSERGWRPCALGRRTLQTEVATVALCASLKEQLRDW